MGARLLMQPRGTEESKNASLTHPIPTVIGRYEIVGMLGRGGMATVYLARSAGEAGFSRLFAIKVLHPHLADDEGFVKMLLEEGQIAARLHHPNVVPIVDLGSQGDLRYVVLEYVEGCALNALLSKQRDVRPPRLVIPIIIDALSGLHAAHMLTDDDGHPMNLVHRDISPQNVLVGVDGAARITDFGVAKAEARVNTTRPGQIKGKLAFMSPEQLKGIEVDRRSDLFSAGCLLFSALTGRRLFLGPNDAATMSNILWLQIPPPSAVGLKPPPFFDEICLRALERDRDKRWSSAAEMEDALREVAQKHGLLGSRREVSEWVTSGFQGELQARRDAVREAASRSRSRVADTGGEWHPVASGLRMIPGVGQHEYDSDPSTPHSRGLQALPVPLMAAAPPAPVRPLAGLVTSHHLRIAGAALGALLAGALGVWFLLRSPAPPARSMAQPLTSAASVAAAPPAAPTTTVAPVAPRVGAPPDEPAATTGAPARTTNETMPTPPKANWGSWAKKSPPPSTPAAVSTISTPASTPPLPATVEHHSSPNCDPPFVVDTNGIEHFKPGCL
jgi:eukaryotic-like serine/threonine-protein kinase